MHISRIAEFEDDVRVVGQPPLMVALFDDKEHVNEMLRKDGRFTMPKSWSVESEQEPAALGNRGQLLFPVVAKPIRGRGSYGVKICHSMEELDTHARWLLRESPKVMRKEISFSYAHAHVPILLQKLFAVTNRSLFAKIKHFLSLLLIIQYSSGRVPIWRGSYNYRIPTIISERQGRLLGESNCHKIQP